MLAYPPKVLMFDLDGTLVDTMFGFADLAGEVMGRHHGDGFELARARYLDTSGVPFAQQLEIIHPDHPANAVASAEFERRKRKICEEAPLEEETRMSLRALRARGLALVVSSNTGSEFVEEFVRREGFDFDLALGFDREAGLAKGTPHVTRVVKTLHVTTQDIWLVGDSLKDSDLAAEAGVGFIGRVGTFRADSFRRHRPGTPTIDRIGDLLALVSTQTAAAG